MNAKLDRRKKYTRMVLKESLIQELEVKPLSAITVKEICAKADINRSTFYAHYNDQYDLLYKIEEEIIEDMNQFLSNYNFTKEEESIKMTQKLLEYIISKEDICRVLLNKHADTTFEKRVMNVARQFIIKNTLTNTTVDQTTSEYWSTFVISGIINVIKDWLEDGMNQSPYEMAQMINQFTKQGLSYINPSWFK
ncbi:TetR/AcrR family transcriptional regulator [Gracilibacillus halophilus YIM-C55.5]|uniref:TetR/AcrR family transcriptional regulator n=1 Tax=Gracilibacillus halophilus YIM-C55.5 TaxID=1308866 RepID=N4WRS6_9BACI|nr:TetR-like C-terminal domain-containing protein [Gracilibacillus halophilus]ENH95906.1 TetR/AcrR family transcriptional regulator [Gracilibacillus halophilus YIM-C55.5]